MHHCRHDLGRRGECRAMDAQRDACGAAPLCQNAQPPIAVAVGRRHDPLGDLGLKHQRQRRPARRPGLARQPVDEQRGPDIIRQVRDNVASCSQCIVERHPQRVALDHPQCAGVLGRELCQCGEAAAVALDGGHARTGIDQRARQPAGPRPDLENICPRQVAGHAGDAVEQLRIEKEVLPKRLRRRQAMARDDGAQRFAHVRRAHAHARVLPRQPSGLRRSSPPDWPGCAPRCRKPCHDRVRSARSEGRASR